MLVVLFASAVATYVIAYRVANQAYDYSLLDTARTIGARIHSVAVAASADGGLSPGAREVLEFDPLDKVFYGVSSERYGLLAGRGDLPLPDAAPGAEGSYYDGTIDGRIVRLISLPLDDGLRIVVAETLNKRQTLTREILGALLFSEALLIVVGGTLLWYGIGRGMAPLRRIVDALALRGQHDLRPVDADPAPAELRYLAHAINDLMRRLDQSLSAQHRFIADAAHQLRTPLAGLLAQIEGAFAENDPRALHAIFARLQTASKRAARLVNQLLTLARSRTGSTKPRSSYELSSTSTDLIRRTCKYWVPEALRKGVDLGFTGIDTKIPIEGNSPLLEEMLGNLIENAICYGNAGGTIDVSVERHADGRTLLEVRNEGLPIPEAEREQIFERFHRLSGSPGNGCGLGLAIVRDVARMHNATVELRSDVAGNTFLVVFHDKGSATAGRAPRP